MFNKSFVALEHQSSYRKHLKRHPTLGCLKLFYRRHMVPFEKWLSTSSLSYFSRASHFDALNPTKTSSTLIRPVALRA